MGRVAALGIAVSLVGCDYALHIDHVNASDAHEVLADAAIDAPFTGLCAGKVIDDSFPSGGGTCPWGTLNQSNATVMASNGTLTVTPISTTGMLADGSCTAPLVTFASGGVIAHITGVIGGSNSWTQIQALGGANASIQISAGDLIFGNDTATQTWARTPYLGTSTMAWVRLRPDRAAGKILAEYSGDAVTWTQFGEVTTTVPAIISPVIDAGVNMSAPFTGTAKYARFIVCSS